MFINIVKLSNINNYIDELIKHNDDFINWITYEKLNQKNEAKFIKIIKEGKIPLENLITEEERVQKIRKVQNIFRKKVLSSFKKCIITGITEEGLLVASHIKPWSKCIYDEKRIDLNNGLLLSGTFDKLFDGGYISFTDNSELMISSCLSFETIKKLKIENGKKYDLKLNEERKKYLDYHRLNIFKK